MIVRYEFNRTRDTKKDRDLLYILKALRGNEIADVLSNGEATTVEGLNVSSRGKSNDKTRAIIKCAHERVNSAFLGEKKRKTDERD